MAKDVYPEIWRPYPHNKVYEISTEARVRRKFKNGKVHYIKPRRAANGRMQIEIGKGENKMVNIGLSRAVWETFRGQIPDGYKVRFVNGCPSMCDLYNLYIQNESEYLSALMKKRTKRIERRNKKKVINNDTGEIYESINQAAKKLYVSKRTIHNSIEKKYKSSIVNVSLYEEKADGE